MKNSGDRGFRVRDLYRRPSLSTMFGGLLLFLALFAKESAVSVPLIWVAWAPFLWQKAQDRRRAIGTWVWAGGATILWAVIFVFWGRSVSGKPTGFGYDFSLGNLLSNFSAHFLDFSNTWVEQGNSTVMPPNVVAWSLTWEAQVVVLGALCWAAFLVFTGYLIRLGKTQARTDWVRFLALGLTFFIAGAAPFVPFVDRLFMRYSYFSHLGIAIMVAVFFRAVWKRWVLAQGFQIRPKHGAADEAAG